MKIVYWSGTGNTEKMAELIAKGIEEGGKKTEVINVSEASSNIFDNEETIVLGCPAMGAEVLEEEEFQPMFDACEGKLGGKKIALFGSYGWGDGEWMRNWEEECMNAGAQIACDSVIANGAPDEEAVESCRGLGRTLA